MAELTAGVIVTTGLADPSGSAAAETGDCFDNDGRQFVKATNGSGGAVTVTVAAQAACNQGFSHDIAVEVAAAATKLIGPFDVRFYNDGNGQCQITYSSHTDVTVAVVSLPQA